MSGKDKVPEVEAMSLELCLSVCASSTQFSTHRPYKCGAAATEVPAVKLEPS